MCWLVLGLNLEVLDGISKRLNLNTLVLKLLLELLD
jgi:hypothetical protein